MAPPTSAVPKKPALVSPSNPPKGPPQSVKFEMDVCTSAHAGCNGQHHLHTHGHGHSHNPSPPHSMSVTNPSRPGVARSNGESSHHHHHRHPRSKKVTPPTPSSSAQNPKSYVSILKKQMMAPPPPVILPSRRKPNSNNNNLSSVSLSHSQRCSSYIMSCSDVALKNAPINKLKEKTLRTIFSYLNHPDLLNCRAVQRRWNRLISDDEQFLDTTVFVVNIHKQYVVPTDSLSYTDLLQWANMPFRHGRFQYIDYRYLKEPQFFGLCRKSDNENYFPRPTFLRTLTSLEFRYSYLLWSTLKRILTKSILLEELKIFNCCISESSSTTGSQNEFDDFTAGNTIFGLRTFEIYETYNLDNITRLLEKFNGYSNQSLTTLKIAYHPPAIVSNIPNHSKSEWIDLCRELKTLISMCSNSLKVLVLDIQHESTLDLLGYHLSKELEALGRTLDLTEFQLSPSMGVWLHKPERIPKQNVAMTMKHAGVDGQNWVKVAATSLARFLESQKNLKKLGLPCIEYPEAYSSCFKSVLKRLPCAPVLEDLAVPCAGFLPDDFLHHFPNLKRLKVGASCCGDLTSSWDAFSYYNGEEISYPPDSANTFPMHAIMPGSNDNMQDGSKDKMKSIEELCISTVECPEKFSVLLQNLCNLTSLEVSSTLGTPVLCDNDLQACVKYLKNLKILMVGGCEKLTDYGITGIPLQNCQLMFKLQKYHSVGVNPNVWKSAKVHGRPLSDLKRLQKLVLTGSCSFTDIGIGYGLSFQELKYCHLPYSHTITSWGIERFGEMNPSLDSFILSGVHQFSKEAFVTLRQTHEGLKKGDSSRSGYYWEQKSTFVDDFSLVLPSPQEVVTAVLTNVKEMICKMLPVRSRGSPANNQVEMDVRGGGDE